MENELDSLVTDWVTDLRNSDKSPGTIDTYERSTRSFLTVSGAEHPADVTKNAIRAWQRTMADSLAVSTQQTRYAGLASFVKWLVADGELVSDPMTTLRRPVPKPVPVEPYTDLEQKQLLASCEPLTSFTNRRDHAILTVLLHTGMRVNEAACIKLADVDREAQSIFIIGKGRKPRSVPYGKPVADALMKYLRYRHNHRYADSERLWLGERGPLTKRAVQALIERRAKRAGIDNVHAHKFRHTAAIHYLNMGLSESTVMNVFGWSSVTMLQRYVAAKRTDLAHAEFHRVVDLVSYFVGEASPAEMAGSSS